MKLHPATADMRIPAPTIKEEDIIFHRIARVGRWEPFGYQSDPEDDQILVPVVDELVLLEKAKAYLKGGYSLRDVASWLSAESGRYISHQGLKVRVAADQKKSADYINSKHLAKQLASAYKKARQLESERLGEDCPSILEEIMQIVGETS